MPNSYYYPYFIFILSFITIPILSIQSYAVDRLKTLRKYILIN